jgi:hypothetical protein
MLVMPSWTKAYYGVSHLGELSDARWCTVTEFVKGGAKVTRWSKNHVTGQRLSDEVEFDTVDQAKHAGEMWVSR